MIKIIKKLSIAMLTASILFATIGTSAHAASKDNKKIQYYKEYQSIIKKVNTSKNKHLQLKDFSAISEKNLLTPTKFEKVVKGDIDKNVLMEYLIDDFDCEKIYDSDEELITDAFFTLKHYASGEEEVSKDEWMYFLECLAGKREYNMETKMSITTKPPHRQA